MEIILNMLSGLKAGAYEYLIYKAALKQNCSSVGALAFDLSKRIGLLTVKAGAVASKVLTAKMQVTQVCGGTLVLRKKGQKISAACATIENPAMCSGSKRFSTSKEDEGTFPSVWDKRTTTTLICAEIIPLATTVYAPAIMAPKARRERAVKKSYYALAMVDLDAPHRNPFGGATRGKASPYLHWLLMNIPGTDFVWGDLSEADVLSKYAVPSPPAGSGYHRYVVVVYRQGTSELKFKKLTRRQARRTTATTRVGRASTASASPLRSFSLWPRALQRYKL